MHKGPKLNFDWNNLAKNLQEDALSDGKKKYAVDERFYKLARNDADQGGALLRFMPDPEGVMFVKLTKISANKGYQKRFCTEWSPQTIGLPDPFNERWAEEWNKGNKEESKRFGRSIRYVSNVKVVKDPANPENEGKIFLLDMSQTIFEKVTNAAQPSPDEVALGAEPKQIFNPLDGNSFLMKVKRASNGFISYEDSKFDEKTSGIYASEAEYNKDIKENGHKLNDFLKPEFFLSYDELKQKLAWYTNEEAPTAPVAPVVEASPAAPVVEAAAPVAAPVVEAVVAPVVETPAPTAAPATSEVDELDDLLDEFDL